MPRRRHESKRRHELTLDVLNVIATHDRTSWETYWGGRPQARAAFAALAAAEPDVLEARRGETYEQWLRRWHWDAEKIRQMDPRADPAPAGEDEEAVEPWKPRA